MFRNHTPHALHIRRTDGTFLDLEPEKSTARVEATYHQIDCINGVDVNACRYGEVTGLPAPAKGVFLIVSLLTAQCAPKRTDLLVPGPLLRNAAGVVTGCNGLVVPSDPGL